MNASLPKLHLVRHGETAWTISGQHTGRTDIALTERGEDEARTLAIRLLGIHVSKVLTSPLQRARRTAELAGFGKETEVDPDLAEWDYGSYEGRRTADIRAERPGWRLFEGGQKVVDLVSDDYKSTIAVDAILTGAGRMPNVEGLDLEAAGVDCDAGTGVRVDDFLRTSNPRIYAAGDVCLQHKFTHTADASARIAVQNALFLGRRRLSALTIPWCTYTDPEIAHVGLYVREARERNIPVKTFTIPMHDVDRAVADGEETGFVKIHVKEGSDRILGATVVASHAGEMINEITLAMVAGIGLGILGRVIHAYPTQADAIRQAADAYSRTRLTPTIRSLLRRWLAW